jgi:hypothetical protein
MRVPVSSEPPEDLGQLCGLTPKRTAAIPAVGKSAAKKPAAKNLLTPQAKADRVMLTRILSNMGKGPNQPK